MNPCMYILMASPGTTAMSPGKLAAQAAHAAVEAWQISDKNSQVVNRWYCGGHYMKIVLMADDLRVAERYINDRGFKTALIIDEGRTEFEGGLTPTAIGVEILDKNALHVKQTFGAFKLYSVPDPEPTIVERPALSRTRIWTRKTSKPSKKRPTGPPSLRGSASAKGKAGHGPVDEVEELEFSDYGYP